jgi:RNA polymerase sigma-70 factor (ECF subfamily)
MKFISPEGVNHMKRDIQDAWQTFAAGQDQAAFAPLFEATRALVYTICMRISLDEEDAAEAFQATYARLLAMAKNDQERPAVTDAGVLIQRLAVREADALRKRHLRRARREVAVEQIPDSAHASASALDEASQRELREKLELFVATLPDKFRLPLQLHYFHGMTHEEIAATLNVPRTTVTGRIQKGLKKLRPMLQRAGLGEATAAFAGVAALASLLAPPAKLAAAGVVFAAAKTAAPVLGGFSVASLMAKPGVFATLGAAKVAVLAGILIVTVALTATVTQNGGFRGSAAVLPTDASAMQTDVDYDALPQAADAPRTAQTTRSAADAGNTVARADTSSAAAPSTVTLDMSFVWSDNGEKVTLANFTVVPLFRADEQGEPVRGFIDLSGRTVVEVSQAPRVELEVQPLQMKSIRSVHDVPENGQLQVTVLRPTSLIGKVINQESGEPVEGATISSANSKARTYSLPDGTFKLFDLEAGKDLLTVKIDGLQLGDATGQPFPVELQANKLNGPVTISLTENCVIIGKVISRETGNPVKGATVGYHTAEFMWEPDLSTTTAGDGTYRLTGIPNKRSFIRASASGFVSTGIYVTPMANEPTSLDLAMKTGATVDILVLDAEGNPAPGATIGIIKDETAFRNHPDKSGSDGHVLVDDVDPENPDEFEAKLEGKGQSQRLRPVFAGMDRTDLVLTLGGSRIAEDPKTFIHGRVTDEQGIPIPDVTVMKGSPSQPDLLKTTTDFNGNYRITYHMGSQDIITFWKEGFGFVRRTNPEPTVDGTEINITLPAEHTAYGVVVNERDEPLANMSISPEPGDSTERGWNKFPVPGYDRITTSEAGEFRIGGLPPGNLYITITHPDFSNVKRLSIPVDQPQRIILRSAGVIAGRAITEDGTPVSTFRVSVEGSGLDMGRSTGGEFFSAADGRFILRNLQQEQVYDIVIEADGFAPHLAQGISATPPDAAPVDYVLTRGTETLIALVDIGTGEPVANAEVYHGLRRGNYYINIANPGANSRAFHTLSRTVSDADGLLTIREGNIRDTLLISITGYAPMIVKPADRVRFEGRNVNALIIPLSGGTGFRGRLTLNDQPVANAEVEFTCSECYRLFGGGSENRKLRTNEDGSFERLGLPASKHTMVKVEWSRDGVLRRASRMAEIKEGEVWEPDFDLREGPFVLSGSTVYAGQAIAGVQVAATHPDTHATIVKSSDNGTFTIPGFGAAEYTINLDRDARGDMPALKASEQLQIENHLSHTFDLAPQYKVKGKLDLSAADRSRQPLIQYSLECVECEKNYFQANTASTSPEFEFTGRYSGTYRLRIQIQDRTIVVLDKHPINNTQADVDLGLLPMPKTGELEVAWKVEGIKPPPEEIMLALFYPGSGQPIALEVETNEGPVQTFPVQSGTYTAVALIAGFSGKIVPETITVVEGEKTTLSITAVPAGMFMGRVVNRGGEDVEAVNRITLSGPGTSRTLVPIELEEQLMSDYFAKQKDVAFKNGFLFWNLPEGEYSVTVDAPGYLPYTKVWTVVAGSAEMEGNQIVLDPAPTIAEENP